MLGYYFGFFHWDLTNLWISPRFGEKEEPRQRNTAFIFAKPSGQAIKRSLILDGYTEKVEFGSQGVQHILKRHLLSVSQDKPPAAPHQVNVDLVGTGNRVSYDLPVSPHIVNFGKGQGAFGIRKQPLDCHLVPVITFHLAPRRQRVNG